MEIFAHNFGMSMVFCLAFKTFIGFRSPFEKCSCCGKRYYVQNRIECEIPHRADDGSINHIVSTSIHKGFSPVFSLVGFYGLIPLMYYFNSYVWN